MSRTYERLDYAAIFIVAVGCVGSLTVGGRAPYALFVAAFLLAAARRILLAWHKSTELAPPARHRKGDKP